jgi:phosphatidylinositol-3-phosphatase
LHSIATRIFCCIFLFLASLAWAQSTNSVPRSGHVVLVIEENHGFSEVYPNGMPWLIWQTQTNGTMAANFSSPINNTGSLGAYLWLSSGSTESQFGCNGGGCSNPITDDNIFRELDIRGVTWKVYVQSLPGEGYIADGPFPYVKRHNPAVWYSSVLGKPSDLQRVVPFTQFSQDLNSNNLPEYSIIIPDLLNDAHDGTLAQADTFLQTNITSLLQSSYFQSGGDGLLLVTFDECGSGENGSCGAHVFSALLGPLVKHGYVSNTAYSHSDMLRTIEDALGLQPYFGAAASARGMTDFFTALNTSGGCGITGTAGAFFCSPVAGQTYTSPVAINGAGRAASGSVNHMELWIDGHKVGNYFSNQVSTTVALGSGAHAATLVEVDSTGSYIKSNPANFSVAGCAPPSSPGVLLCSLVAGQSYTSPVEIIGAGTLANVAVNHLELWIDGHKIGNYAGNTINTSVTESAGSHAATLVAVDAKGNYLKSVPMTYNVR